MPMAGTTTETRCRATVALGLIAWSGSASPVNALDRSCFASYFSEAISMTKQYFTSLLSRRSSQSRTGESFTM